MNLKNDIARLKRAGSENSAWLNKLRKSVDQLVEHLKKLLPERQKWKLPRGVTFVWYDVNGEYVLARGPSWNIYSFYLASKSKSRGCLLQFADCVANGWFDEAVDYLAKGKAVPVTAEEEVEERRAD